MKFDYNFLMFFESYTLIFFFLVSNFRSSYERGGAMLFLIVFGYVLGFGVVISNSLVMMRMVLLLLGLAKLPMYRLHVWLPKVHVEASIVRSMVLARAVLKLGIIYVWNFGGIMMIRTVVVISCLIMMSVVDRKGFAAYSSVLHISLCVILGLIVIILVRYIHIVLSPLMFISVYIMYQVNGRRFYIKAGLIILML